LPPPLCLSSLGDTVMWMLMRLYLLTQTITERLCAATGRVLDAQVLCVLLLRCSSLGLHVHADPCNVLLANSKWSPISPLAETQSR